MEQWFYLLRTPIDELDATTQEMVYRSFYQLVYRDIFFIVREHPLTEDIIQDAFLKATAQGPKLQAEINLSWIKTVTRNTAIDKLRKLKKERQILHEQDVNIEKYAFDEVSVATEVENKERNSLLHQSINELKPSYRILLQMFYIEGKPYKDVCQELEMTESVMTQRLARARKKLLHHFTRKWRD